MENLFNTVDPLLLASSAGGIILFAIVYLASQAFTEKKTRSDVKKRLIADEPKRSILNLENTEQNKDTKKKVISNKVAKKANEFYSNTDPNSIKKLRMMMMQAGYMNPSAAGYFIASRFIGAVIGIALGGFLVLVPFAYEPFGLRMCILMFLVVLGYFSPNIYINKRSKKIEIQNRQGFPDILDLMVVSAEAGLTMEASIERISQEIKKTYPNLSTQLNMAALEIRAGRPLDQSLRAFGERLRLEEVKGFATMMRHKRMMQAEEKAYALPAKMSIPVTLFILPIVIGIAIIPTIVRYNI